MQGQLVCAWCNKKKKDIQLVTEGKSHGICPTCLKRVFGFTVQEMYAALAQREEAAKLAKANERIRRRNAKKGQAHRVR